MIPDGTLNTAVTQTGSDITITNGSAVGPNLFHSFREFSLPTGGTATFDLGTTPDVATIFSRVTGGVVSSIDGSIQSSHPVNFFLLNPTRVDLAPMPKSTRVGRWWARRPRALSLLMAEFLVQI